MYIVKDVDAEIDEWKRSQEFNDLPHGDELVNDFDKWVTEQKEVLNNGS